VTAERRVFGMPGDRIVELVPQQPLAPGGRYEIVIATRHEAPPWRRGRGVVKPSPRRHVSPFIAGPSIDETPPIWTGVTGVEVAGRRDWKMVKPDGTVVIWEDDGRSAPWLVVRAPAATDDATPEWALSYGVWVADQAGRVDYARLPLSHLSWRNGRILAGRDEAVPERSMCDVATFPSLDPRRPSPLRIGLRAIDWAGNVSAPSEVVLDAKPP
jgi:hypothetical protein